MVAFILFILATAGVKGFAFTLGIGTLTSLFTAVLATQAVLGTMRRSPLITHPTALGAGERASAAGLQDFMGASKWFFSMSGVILLIGALAIGGKGLNFGIDFESGTRVKVAFDHGAPTRDAGPRRASRAAGFRRPRDPARQAATRSSGGNGFQISTSTLSRGQKSTGIQQVLEKKFGMAKAFQTATRSARRSARRWRSRAIIAIIASLLVISAYIALRFEWKFAVPVLIALMHDLLITAGVYSLTGREVTTSTVAALLTILGYSLYDTIIVFDRIRENVPRMPRAAFTQIVNRSMSEVLTRSLATSFCTLLPILALLFFGGDTLKDFAFALLVGVDLGRVLVDLHRLAGAHALEGARGGLPPPPPIADRRGQRRPGARLRGRRASGITVDVAPRARQRPTRRHHRRPRTPSAASRRPSSSSWCATSARDGAARSRPRRARARAGRPGIRRRRAARGPRAQGRQARTSPSARATSATGGPR